MLEEIKEKVCKANLKLYKSGIVISTFGNVSQIDRKKGLVVIKPSGVKYSLMGPNDMIIVDLDGNIVEGNLNPSTDTPTHLALYKAYKNIGGVTHTHSSYATVFAQAGLPIKSLGTTHADNFFGDIPCTRSLSEEEVKNDYELNTGRVIVETIKDAKKMPGVLVRHHGVFTFGENAIKSVETAIILEEVAKMAYKTLSLNADAQLQQYVLNKHYNRKHGKSAYYGQK